MLMPQSPISDRRRKPLQPKNQSPTPFNFNINVNVNAKASPNPTELIEVDNPNKENIPPIYSTPVKNKSFQIQSLDVSLAEELSAMREKLERVRIDKDKTEKMLIERGLMLDLQMKELVDRGELQKEVEIEVDRLYRLKQIKLSCMRISPLGSLRNRVQEKKTKDEQMQANNKTEENQESSLQISNSHTDK